MRCCDASNHAIRYAFLEIRCEGAIDWGEPSRQLREVLLQVFYCYVQEKVRAGVVLLCLMKGALVGVVLLCLGEGVRQGALPQGGRHPHGRGRLQGGHSTAESVAREAARQDTAGSEHSDRIVTSSLTHSGIM